MAIYVANGRSALELTVAEIIAAIRVLRPRSLAAVTADQAFIAAERLHQNAANWYYRP